MDALHGALGLKPGDEPVVHLLPALDHRLRRGQLQLPSQPREFRPVLRVRVASSSSVPQPPRPFPRRWRRCRRRRLPEVDPASSRRGRGHAVVAAPRPAAAAGRRPLRAKRPGSQDADTGEERERRSHMWTVPSSEPLASRAGRPASDGDARSAGSSSVSAVTALACPVSSDR